MYVLDGAMIDETNITKGGKVKVEFKVAHHIETGTKLLQFLNNLIDNYSYSTPGLSLDKFLDRLHLDKKEKASVLNFVEMIEYQSDLRLLAEHNEFVDCRNLANNTRKLSILQFFQPDYTTDTSNNPISIHLSVPKEEFAPINQESDNRNLINPVYYNSYKSGYTSDIYRALIQGEIGHLLEILSDKSRKIRYILKDSIDNFINYYQIEIGKMQSPLIFYSYKVRTKIFDFIRKNNGDIKFRTDNQPFTYCLLSIGGKAIEFVEILNRPIYSQSLPKFTKLGIMLLDRNQLSYESRPMKLEWRTPLRYVPVNVNPQDIKKSYQRRELHIYDMLAIVYGKLKYKGLIYIWNIASDNFLDIGIINQEIKKYDMEAIEPKALEIILHKTKYLLSNAKDRAALNGRRTIYGYDI